MLKRLCCLFFYIILITYSLYGQSRSAVYPFSGQIVDQSGMPLESALITFSNSRLRILSDAKGYFTINHLQAGHYRLKVTYMDAVPLFRDFVYDGFHPVSVKLVVSVNDAELQRVYVTGGFNKFNKKETEDIARLPIKNIENPQSYSVVTKELIQEQSLTDYNSIFRNIPGAGVPIVYNQGRAAFFSRGFQTANLIRNSVSGYVYTNIDPQNIERVEAIKGPSGTLFNSSMVSYGGLFNRVTKKPYTVNQLSIGYASASYNLNRITVDYNRVLDSAKGIFLRTNAALHGEKSFQDAGFTKSFMIAPSLLYRFNDRVSLLLDLEVSRFTSVSPIRFAPYAKGHIYDVRKLGMRYDLSFSNNSLSYTTREVNVYAQLNYKITPHWKLQANYTRTYSTTEGYVTQLIGKSDSTLQQSAQIENFPYNGTELQVNLNGDFSFFGLRNRFLIGADLYNQRSDRSTPTVTLPAINFRHPGSAYYRFNARVVDSLAAHATYSVYSTNEYIYGSYISDVINFTDRFLVMLSLRVNRYQNKGTFYPATDSVAGAYEQTNLSPKLGVVYQILPDKISMFGNYMNGFSNTGGTGFLGQTFKPEQANQWESGLKLDLWNHRIVSTISYYHIKVSNTLRTDPDHAGYSIQDGTQLSEGIEAELIANPFTGLNIFTGFSHNRNHYISSDSTVLGLRPASAGPEDELNWYLSYKRAYGTLKGLGVGWGGNWGSSSFQTNTHSFVFSIPCYFVMNAVLFYEKPSYRVSLKAENLTGEKYWSLRLAPQMPLRIGAELILKF